MYHLAVGSGPAFTTGREFYLFSDWRLLIVGLLVGLLTASPVQAQTDGDTQLDHANKELAATVPLQALQAMPDKASTRSIPAAVKQSAKAKTLPAAIPDNLSVFQYLAMLSADGWSINWAFSGPFSNSQNVSNIVDNDLLKEYHCKMQGRQILQRGARRIIIDAYQFDTTDGAYGSYCAAHRGSSNFLPDSDAASEDPDSISFCKDNYFFCLYGGQTDDEEAKAAISKLAIRLVAKIKQSQYVKQFPGSLASAYAESLAPAGNKRPAIFNLMPAFERLAGSEKVVMGATGMKRFFPAPYSANLVPLLNGSVADYKLEWPDRDRLRLLIAHYPSAQAAGLIYANYTSTLSSEHSEKSADGYTCPTAMFKVANGFLLCQLRDKQIIVITGARHKDSLSQLAHQIYL